MPILLRLLMHIFVSLLICLRDIVWFNTCQHESLVQLSHELLKVIKINCFDFFLYYWLYDN